MTERMSSPSASWSDTVILAEAEAATEALAATLVASAVGNEGALSSRAWASAGTPRASVKKVTHSLFIGTLRAGG